MPTMEMLEVEEAGEGLEERIATAKVQVGTRKDCSSLASLPLGALLYRVLQRIQEEREMNQGLLA